MSCLFFSKSRVNETDNNKILNNLNAALKNVELTPEQKNMLGSWVESALTSYAINHSFRLHRLYRAYITTDNGPKIVDEARDDLSKAKADETTMSKSYFTTVTRILTEQLITPFECKKGHSIAHSSRIGFLLRELKNHSRDLESMTKTIPAMQMSVNSL